MKYLCGVLVVVLVAGVVSAAPRPLDFGEVVRNVLKMKGISIDKNAKASVQENVGDIWSDCGSSGDIGKIGNVDIIPDPPQKGTNLTVDASATLSEEVKAGSLAVELQYYVLGIPVKVIDDTYELCGEETGLTCPLAAGGQSVKFASEVPSSAPGGKYTGKAVATSKDDGKQIICINLEFNL